MRGVGTNRSSQPTPGGIMSPQRSSISPPRCQARGLAGDTGGAPTSRWPVAASPPDFRRRASHVLPGARWLGFQPANRGDQAQPLGLPGCAGCPGPDGAISTGARCLAASAAGPCIARETGRSSSRVAPAVSASPLAVRHVSSKMIIGVRVPGSGCHLHMSAGRVPGRDGHCRAGQGRSGYAERKDSGNDENSPDTHDSSMAIPEVSGLLHGPASLHGVSAVLRGYFPGGSYFMRLR